MHHSVSDVNFDIHSDSHPTTNMETSSSSSDLTNIQTETDTNKQVCLAIIIKVLLKHVQAIQQTTLSQ